MNINELPPLTDEEAKAAYREGQINKFFHQKAIANGVQFNENG